jgi:2-hydroxy-6-oxonona-2,4-dienedioate hydrolase
MDRSAVPRRLTVSIILLLVLAAIIVYGAYLADMNEARERLAAGSELIATACGPIEYAIAGTGPPVLVVHGAGGGFDQGLLMAADLIERGYRAIAVSRFGYLRTPLPDDASAEAQADAHACLLDALGVDRVAVFGASAGAPSSLQLALRHPARLSALVLLVPATWLPASPGAGTEVPRGLPVIFDTALKWDFPLWGASKVARRPLIRTMLGTPPELLDDLPAAERERVERMLDLVLPVTARRAGLLNDGVVTTTLERYELEAVQAPTLVISAEDDLYGTFERARYTAGEIPGARFVGFENGGHLLAGRQEQVTAAINKFLRAADERTATQSAKK